MGIRRPLREAETRNIAAGVFFTTQSSNGACVISDKNNTVGVDRTATGKYTWEIRDDNWVLPSGTFSIIDDGLFVTPLHGIAISTNEVTFKWKIESKATSPAVFKVEFLRVKANGQRVFDDFSGEKIGLLVYMRV